MGSFLDKPKTEKVTHSGSGFGLKYASSAMQGWRMEMEDADVCDLKSKLENFSFFGVFDGHAGSNVSKYASEHLLENIIKCLPSQPDSDGNYEVEDIKKAMEDGFLRMDKQIKSDPPWAGQDHSGSTAIVALVSPTHIFWANCGDSRSIFCRNKDLCFATNDHKPFNNIEKNRIEKAGGTVMMQRINGTLAVSRALGDFDYKGNTSLDAKEQLVSPLPDVTVMERDLEHDEFLLLACDGIFDVMTNEAILEYVRRRLGVTDNLSGICENLIDICLHKNSRDNMSVILVTFPGAPKVSEEAIEKEKERKETFVQAVDEALKVMASNVTDAMDLEENNVLSKLASYREDLTDDLILENKPLVLERLQTVKQEKFGKDDFLSDAVDERSGDQLVGADINPMIIRDVSEFHGYDQQLLDLGTTSGEIEKDEENEVKQPLEDDQMDTEDGNSSTLSA